MAKKVQPHFHIISCSSSFDLSVLFHIEVFLTWLCVQKPLRNSSILLFLSSFLSDTTTDITLRMRSIWLCLEVSTCKDHVSYFHILSLHDNLTSSWICFFLDTLCIHTFVCVQRSRAIYCMLSHTTIMCSKGYLVLHASKETDPEEWDKGESNV